MIKFLVEDIECRLLINYHPELAQYQAMLGIESEGDTKVLLSLEYHPTHKPWHVHAACGDVALVPPGIKRGHWLRCLSASGKRHRMACPTEDDAAFARAVSFFRLDLIADDGSRLL